MKQLKSFGIFIGIISIILLLSDLSAYSQVKVPERGFISSQPGETWEQGLISGNGTLGANVLSQPLDETIIFTHHHLFCQWVLRQCHRISQPVFLKYAS